MALVDAETSAAVVEDTALVVNSDKARGSHLAVEYAVRQDEKVVVTFPDASLKCNQIICGFRN